MTINQQIAQEDAHKLRDEGYSLEQATEYLSWLGALWAELPALAQAYRAEARNLPALYHKETEVR